MFFLTTWYFIISDYCTISIIPLRNYLCSKKLSASSPSDRLNSAPGPHWDSSRPQHIPLNACYFPLWCLDETLYLHVSTRADVDKACDCLTLETIMTRLYVTRFVGVNKRATWSPSYRAMTLAHRLFQWRCRWRTVVLCQCSVRSSLCSV